MYTYKIVCVGVYFTESSRGKSCLSVVGKVHECFTLDGQQFEHFT